MAVKISPGQIQNLQQIEAVVAGPDEANRLVIIDGQFDVGFYAASHDNTIVSRKEIFSTLVGPVLTNKQFIRASATASVTKIEIDVITTPANSYCYILNVDADWDDESGQTELRIEAQVESAGNSNDIQIKGFAFHVTILAAVPAP
jgi:hypothetical protein